jgi:hypothetical protein
MRQDVRLLAGREPQTAAANLYVSFYLLELLGVVIR